MVISNVWTVRCKKNLYVLTVGVPSLSRRAQHTVSIKDTVSELEDAHASSRCWSQPLGGLRADLRACSTPPTLILFLSPVLLFFFFFFQIRQKHSTKSTHAQLTKESALKLTFSSQSCCPPPGESQHFHRILSIFPRCVSWKPDSIKKKTKKPQNTADLKSNECESEEQLQIRTRLHQGHSLVWTRSCAQFCRTDSSTTKTLRLGERSRDVDGNFNNKCLWEVGPEYILYTEVFTTN